MLHPQYFFPEDRFNRDPLFQVFRSGTEHPFTGIRDSFAVSDRGGAAQVGD
jgi:hypothetical protein